jgi:hypothetical protein
VKEIKSSRIAANGKSAGEATTGLGLRVRPKALLAGACRDRACLKQKIGAVIHDADIVSGGYCQHTEGFGEMAEKENR